MKVTVLGCGGSMGTPVVGGHWGACDPTEPRNRRRRPAILMQQDGFSLLVDTPPELRQMALEVGLGFPDAVLYTHDHSDHTHGIDDLRGYYLTSHRKIEIHARPNVLEGLRVRFRYLFEGGGGGFYDPWIVPNELPDEAEIGPFRLTAFDMDHKVCQVVGFRCGDFAYTTDVTHLTPEQIDALRGVGVWIVGCVGRAPHPTHAHLARALDWIDQVRPGRAFLTHMGGSLDYRTLCEELPPHIRPAHDGLEIEI